jgi:hypothetical protein
MTGDPSPRGKANKTRLSLFRIFSPGGMRGGKSDKAAREKVPALSEQLIDLFFRCLRAVLAQFEHSIFVNETSRRVPSLSINAQIAREHR